MTNFASKDLRGWITGVDNKNLRILNIGKESSQEESTNADIVVLLGSASAVHSSGREEAADKRRQTQAR